MLHQIADLGSIDFVLGCSTMTANSGKFPSAPAEMDRQWNTQNQSQPNQGFKPNGTPCSCSALINRREWKQLKGCIFSPFGPPSNGKRKGGEKTQPFNRFHSHPGTSELKEQHVTDSLLGSRLSRAVERVRPDLHVPRLDVLLLDAATTLLRAERIARMGNQFLFLPHYWVVHLVAEHCLST